MGELRMFGMETAERKWTRRQMVQRLLTGIGASAAGPLFAVDHPIHEHFKNDALLTETDDLSSPNWEPLFLNATQNEELIALSECMVPGSKASLVNRFIDLLLSVETPQHQKKFVVSQSAIEIAAYQRFSGPFPSLNAAQQNAVLTFASTKPAKGDSDATELYESFENLKGWIVAAYYSSEAGMRELGWTGDFAFASYPACEHSEGHS
jgi:hypothetical protein